MTRKTDVVSLPMALIYTRVSSEEQAREGVSLDAQLAECRRYAAQQGWVLGSEYQDVLSGKRDDRPSYRRLLADVRKFRADGQAVIVVVFRLDRLGRRILERVRAREEMKSLGVPVHSVREGGEVSDLVANILASVAEEETRTLGERVSAAKQHMAACGWYPPGRAPWGYRLRPATADERTQGSPLSILEPDPVTSPWVQEAFARAAAGASIRAVHRWAKGLPSQARGARVLTFRAISLVLASPVYIGRQPHGDTDVLARPIGRWTPLVDEAIWQQVREHVQRHQRVPHQASQRYLLTGLLRCPDCGTRMHGSKRPGHGSRYRCAATNLGTNAGVGECRTSALSARVDEAVLSEVLPHIAMAVADLPDLREALERAWDSLRTPATLQDALAERQRQQLVREAEQARSRLTTAAVLFADGDIDKTGYELLRDKAQGDLQAATAELERLHVVAPVAALPPLETVIAAAAGWEAVMRDSDIAAQREVLATLIERVEPVRVSRGQYRVTITWTPLGDALRAVSVAPTSVADRPAA
jgi:site-specific DNA recombinase